MCTILKIGINHTYLIITPTKKFVFRVYFLNWRTETEIEEELKLLYSLQEKGVAVSYPIKDNNHKEIQKIVAAEGERFAVLRFKHIISNDYQLLSLLLMLLAIIDFFKEKK